jgi:hypothetical protein
MCVCVPVCMWVCVSVCMCFVCRCCISNECSISGTHDPLDCIQSVFSVRLIFAL